MNEPYSYVSYMCSCGDFQVTNWCTLNDQNVPTVPLREIVMLKSVVLRSSSSESVEMARKTCGDF